VAISKRGKEIYRAPLAAGNPEKQADALVGRIKAALRTNYLVNRLKLQEPALKVACTLVPVLTDERGQYRDTLPQAPLPHPRLQLAEATG
jgi:hypothetical protein